MHFINPFESCLFFLSLLDQEQQQKLLALSKDKINSIATRSPLRAIAYKMKKQYGYAAEKKTELKHASQIDQLIDLPEVKDEPAKQTILTELLGCLE